LGLLPVAFIDQETTAVPSIELGSPEQTGKRAMFGPLVCLISDKSLRE
jgi:hypothetical protein